MDVHDDEVIISLRNAEQHLSIIVTLLVAKQIPISSISIHKPTLEDVFLSFTGKTIREQEAGPAEIMRQQMKKMGRH